MTPWSGINTFFQFVLHLTSYGCLTALKWSLGSTLICFWFRYLISGVLPIHTHTHQLHSKPSFAQSVEPSAPTIQCTISYYTLSHYFKNPYANHLNSQMFCSYLCLWSFRWWPIPFLTPVAWQHMLFHSRLELFQVPPVCFRNSWKENQQLWE